MTVRTTTWPMVTGAVVGTTVIHLAAVVVLLALLNVEFREHFRFEHDDNHFIVSQPPAAVFEVAPLPAQGQGYFTIATGARCGGEPIDSAPVAVKPVILHPRQTFKRSPRVCVRVRADGVVGSARVLWSSGDAGADAAVEDSALQLAFVPATRLGLPVAATVTLDVIGNLRPSALPVEALTVRGFAPL